MRRRRAVPLDGNAKAHIAAYARAWSGRHRHSPQHKPAQLQHLQGVLEALRPAGATTASAGDRLRGHGKQQPVPAVVERRQERLPGVQEGPGAGRRA